MVRKQIPTTACIAILVLSLGLAGCQTMGTQDGSNQATKEGAVGGAMIGALIGALIGGKDGALIGAALGGAVGGVAGHEIDKRKKEYASTEAFYDGQLAQTKELNTALAENNQNLRKSINEDEAQIKTLVESFNSGKTDNTALAAKKSEIDQKVTNTATRITALNEELKIQQAVLTEINETDVAKENSGDGKYAGPLATEIAMLENEIAELNEMQDAMASQSATIGQYM